jgi:hypothetical protein
LSWYFNKLRANIRGSPFFSLLDINLYLLFHECQIDFLLKPLKFVQYFNEEKYSIIPGLF